MAHRWREQHAGGGRTRGASLAVVLFIGWLLAFSGSVMAVQAVFERPPSRGLEALLTLIVGSTCCSGPCGARAAARFLTRLLHA
jgi:hypothetical protein